MFKQPHEDVKGTAQASFLLSLDQRAMPHRCALMRVAAHLDKVTAAATAPGTVKLRERISRPVPGDLVAEVTVAVHAPTSSGGVRGLGVLLEAREEWAQTDPEWERQKADFDLTDGGRPTVTAWYIQYGDLPGDIARWTDGEFMTIPSVAGGERVEQHGVIR